MTLSRSCLRHQTLPMSKLGSMFGAVCASLLGFVHVCPAPRRSCKVEHNRKAAEASFSWPAAHSSPRTANAHQRASNRADDEAWVDCLDDRSWISWARAVAQQDPEKIARIKAVTSMLAEPKRNDEGH
jgi:hypothetical protein